MLRFTLITFVALCFCLFFYRGIVQKDLVARFSEASVAKRIKHDSCVHEYEENYCDIYDIPYLKSYCEDLRLCIETTTFSGASNLATRLQLLIKYFVIDNFDLFLHHYIYMDAISGKEQSKIYNSVFLVVLFALIILVPMHLLIKRGSRPLDIEKANPESKIPNGTITTHPISYIKES
ncbi:hypothetical protein QEN19_002858 [Hanseniaspora menglaensis]